MKYKFLAVVSNHGKGTTYFCSQLMLHTKKIHIGLAEPFGGTSIYPEYQFCHNVNGIFDMNLNEGRFFNKPNAKLQYRLNTFIEHFFHIQSPDPSEAPIVNLCRKLKDKPLNDAAFHEKCDSFESYFLLLRKQLAEMSGCQEIVLSHKIFPAYFTSDFSKVESYLLRNDVLIVHLKRDYSNSRASNKKRFNDNGRKLFANRNLYEDKAWDEYLESLILPNKKKYFQYDVEKDLWTDEKKYELEIIKILEHIQAR